MFLTLLCVKIQAPQTNWTRVVENLDHEGFYFPDEKAFYLFMSIYRNACQVHLLNVILEQKNSFVFNVFNKWR